MTQPRVKDVPGGNLLIHSAMYELDEQEERDYPYKIGRGHYRFV